MTSWNEPPSELSTTYHDSITETPKIAINHPATETSRYYQLDIDYSPVEEDVQLHFTAQNSGKSAGKNEIPKSNAVNLEVAPKFTDRSISASLSPMKNGETEKTHKTKSIHVINKAQSTNLSDHTVNINEFLQEISPNNKKTASSNVKEEKNASHHCKKHTKEPTGDSTHKSRVKFVKIKKTRNRRVQTSKSTIQVEEVYKENIAGLVQQRTKDGEMQADNKEIYFSLSNPKHPFAIAVIPGMRTKSKDHVLDAKNSIIRKHRHHRNNKLRHTSFEADCPKTEEEKIIPPELPKPANVVPPAKTKGKSLGFFFLTNKLPWPVNLKARKTPDNLKSNISDVSTKTNPDQIPSCLEKEKPENQPAKEIMNSQTEDVKAIHSRLTRTRPVIVATALNCTKEIMAIPKKRHKKRRDISLISLYNNANQVGNEKPIESDDSQLKHRKSRSRRESKYHVPKVLSTKVKYKESKHVGIEATAKSIEDLGNQKPRDYIKEHEHPKHNVDTEIATVKTPKKYRNKKIETDVVLDCTKKLGFEPYKADRIKPKKEKDTLKYKDEDCNTNQKHSKTMEQPLTEQIKKKKKRKVVTPESFDTYKRDYSKHKVMLPVEFETLDKLDKKVNRRNQPEVALGGDTSKNDITKKPKRKDPVSEELPSKALPHFSKTHDVHKNKTSRTSTTETVKQKKKKNSTNTRNEGNIRKAEMYPPEVISIQDKITEKERLRKEISFSQLNLNPVTGFYVKPIVQVRNNRFNIQKPVILPPSLTLKEIKKHKKKKVEDKTVVSEAITKKEKDVYLQGKRYQPKASLRNFSKRIMVDAEVHKTETCDVSATPDRNTHHLSPNSSLQLSKNVFSVVNIKPGRLRQRSSNIPVSTVYESKLSSRNSSSSSAFTGSDGRMDKVKQILRVDRNLFKSDNRHADIPKIERRSIRLPRDKMKKPSGSFIENNSSHYTKDVNDVDYGNESLTKAGTKKHASYLNERQKLRKSLLINKEFYNEAKDSLKIPIVSKPHGGNISPTTTRKLSQIVQQTGQHYSYRRRMGFPSTSSDRSATSKESYTYNLSLQETGKATDLKTCTDSVCSGLQIRTRIKKYTESLKRRRKPLDNSTDSGRSSTTKSKDTDTHSRLSNNKSLLPKLGQYTKRSIRNYTNQEPEPIKKPPVKKKRRLASSPTFKDIFINYSECVTANTLKHLDKKVQGKNKPSVNVVEQAQVFVTSCSDSTDPCGSSSNFNDKMLSGDASPLTKITEETLSQESSKYSYLSSSKLTDYNSSENSKVKKSKKKPKEATHDVNNMSEQAPMRDLEKPKQENYYCRLHELTKSNRIKNQNRKECLTKTETHRDKQDMNKIAKAPARKNAELSAEAGYFKGVTHSEGSETHPVNDTSTNHSVHQHQLTQPHIKSKKCKRIKPTKKTASIRKEELKERKIRRLANSFRKNIMKELQAADFLKQDKVMQLVAKDGNQNDMKQLDAIIAKNVADVLKRKVFTSMFSDESTDDSETIPSKPSSTKMQSYTQSEISETKPDKNVTYQDSYYKTQTENEPKNKYFVESLKSSSNFNENCNSSDFECVKHTQSNTHIQNEELENKDKLESKLGAESDFMFLDFHLDQLMGSTSEITEKETTRAHMIKSKTKQEGSPVAEVHSFALKNPNSNEVEKTNETNSGKTSETSLKTNIKPVESRKLDKSHHISYIQPDDFKTVVKSRRSRSQTFSKIPRSLSLNSKRCCSKILADGQSETYTNRIKSATTPVESCTSNSKDAVKQQLQSKTHSTNLKSGTLLNKFLGALERRADQAYVESSNSSPISTSKARTSSCVFAKMDNKSGKTVSTFQKRKQYGEILRRKITKSKYGNENINQDCIYCCPTPQVLPVKTEGKTQGKVPPARPPPPLFDSIYTDSTTSWQPAVRADRYGYAPHGGRQASGVDYNRLCFNCKKLCCCCKTKQMVVVDGASSNHMLSSKVSKQYPNIPTLIIPIKSKQQHKTIPDERTNSQKQENDSVVTNYIFIHKSKSSISTFGRKSVYSRDNFSNYISRNSNNSTFSVGSSAVRKSKSNSILYKNGSDEVFYSVGETKCLRNHRRKVRPYRKSGRPDINTKNLLCTSKKLCDTIEQKRSPTTDNKKMKRTKLEAKSSCEICNAPDYLYSLRSNEEKNKTPKTRIPRLKLSLVSRKSSVAVGLFKKSTSVLVSVQDNGFTVTGNKSKSKHVLNKPSEKFTYVKPRVYRPLKKDTKKTVQINETLNKAAFKTNQQSTNSKTKTQATKPKPENDSLCTNNNTNTKAHRRTVVKADNESPKTKICNTNKATEKRPVKESSSKSKEKDDSYNVYKLTPKVDSQEHFKIFTYDKNLKFNRIDPITFPLCLEYENIKKSKLFSCNQYDFEHRRFFKNSFENYYSRLKAISSISDEFLINEDEFFKRFFVQEEIDAEFYNNHFPFSTILTFPIQVKIVDLPEDDDESQNQFSSGRSSGRQSENNLSMFRMKQCDKSSLFWYQTDASTSQSIHPQTPSKSTQSKIQPVKIKSNRPIEFQDPLLSTNDAVWNTDSRESLLYFKNIKKPCLLHNANFSNDLSEDDDKKSLSPKRNKHVEFKENKPMSLNHQDDIATTFDTKHSQTSDDRYKHEEKSTSTKQVDKSTKISLCDLLRKQLPLEQTKDTYNYSQKKIEKQHKETLCPLSESHSQVFWDLKEKVLQTFMLKKSSKKSKSKHTETEKSEEFLKSVNLENSQLPKDTSKKHLTEVKAPITRVSERVGVSPNRAPLKVLTKELFHKPSEELLSIFLDESWKAVKKVNLANEGNETQRKIDDEEEKITFIPLESHESLKQQIGESIQTLCKEEASGVLCKDENLVQPFTEVLKKYLEVILRKLGVDNNESPPVLPNKKLLRSLQKSNKSLVSLEKPTKEQRIFELSQSFEQQPDNSSHTANKELLQDALRTILKKVVINSSLELVQGPSQELPTTSIVKQTSESHKGLLSKTVKSLQHLLKKKSSNVMFPETDQGKVKSASDNSLTAKQQLEKASQETLYYDLSDESAELLFRKSNDKIIKTKSPLKHMLKITCNESSRVLKQPSLDLSKTFLSKVLGNKSSALITSTSSSKDSSQQPRDLIKIPMNKSTVGPRPSLELFRDLFASMRNGILKHKACQTFKELREDLTQTSSIKIGSPWVYYNREDPLKIPVPEASTSYSGVTHQRLSDILLKQMSKIPLDTLIKMYDSVPDAKDQVTFKNVIDELYKNKLIELECKPTAKLNSQKCNEKPCTPTTSKTCKKQKSSESVINKNSSNVFDKFRDCITSRDSPRSKSKKNVVSKGTESPTAKGLFKSSKKNNEKVTQPKVLESKESRDTSNEANKEMKFKDKHHRHKLDNLPNKSDESTTSKRSKIAKSDVTKADQQAELMKLKEELTNQEIFDRLLDSYDKEERIVEKLSEDEHFINSQLKFADIETEVRVVDSEVTPDNETESSVSVTTDTQPSEIDLTRIQTDESKEIPKEAEDNQKVKFSKGKNFDEEKKLLRNESDAWLTDIDDYYINAQKRSSVDSTDSNAVQPTELGRCFLRGFRNDHVSLSGDVCILISKAEQERRMKPHLYKEAVIDFSERDSPLEYLLALGFSIDEASNAIKDEDVKNRLHAAIIEARIWVNHINAVQGTLLYLVAYKAKPQTMRYFLQLVEAIINKRINNAVKLNSFLRMLEKVEGGDLTMVHILGSDKLEDEENEEKIVKKQLRQLFMDVYQIATQEAELKGQEVTKEGIVLLRILAAKYRAGLHPHLELISRYIGQGLMVNEIQLEAAMIYLSRLDTADVNLKEFEQYCAIKCKRKQNASW